MKYLLTIKNTINVFLLGVFFLAITPQRFLHHLFTNHQDLSSARNVKGGSTNIDKAAFHCDCNHMVATSEYTTFSLAKQPSSFSPYRIFNEAPSSFLFLNLFFRYTLRGPPITVS
ncbi:MAG: hypothetical protein NTZ41_03465 [Sphingobacteriales bacterium]|jgi:hypothetical protein|nr:hypothetical protein [Sphingobacteriales bacterium]